jgi:hypothetical protein
MANYCRAVTKSLRGTKGNQAGQLMKVGNVPETVEGFATSI